MADWFNDDLSDYIDKKEKVIIDVRKNDKIRVLSSFILSLFLSTILGFVGAFVDIRLAIFALLCSFCLFVWLIYNSQRATRYVLTSCGIYRIAGLIFKSTKFVAYNQITDVSISKGPIQTIVGCGSVGVGTASGNVVGSVSDGNGTIYSINELDIDSVNDYKKIREIIIKNRKK